MPQVKTKKSISVPEMGRILGLGKVESYWLVKKNYFTTIQVAGRMRVMLDSFEDWYAGQFHYKKVDGHPQAQSGGIQQCLSWSSLNFLALNRQPPMTW